MNIRNLIIFKQVLQKFAYSTINTEYGIITRCNDGTTGLSKASTVGVKVDVTEGSDETSSSSASVNDIDEFGVTGVQSVLAGP